MIPTTRSSQAGKSRLSVKKGTIEKPKRPANAFLIFMEGFRREYQEEHPDNRLVFLPSKAGGVKWKSFTDDEKAPYVAKAEKLKAEYIEKMHIYNNLQAGGQEASGESDSSKLGSDHEDDNSLGNSRLSVKKSMVEKDPNKPKGPRSAFFLFKERFKKDLLPENSYMKMESMVCKLAGLKWNSLSDVEKAPYLAKAKKLRMEYVKQLRAYTSNPQPQAGDPEASGDSGKDKSESGPEASGDCDKDKCGDSDKDKCGDSDKDKCGDSDKDKSGDSDKHLSGEFEREDEDDGCEVRPLSPHRREFSVLVRGLSARSFGSGKRGRKQPQIVQRFPGCKLWRAATKITGCRRVRRSR